MRLRYFGLVAPVSSWMSPLLSFHVFYHVVREVLQNTATVVGSSVPPFTSIRFRSIVWRHVSWYIHNLQRIAIFIVDETFCLCLCLWWVYWLQNLVLKYTLYIFALCLHIIPLSIVLLPIHLYYYTWNLFIWDKI